MKSSAAKKRQCNYYTLSGCILAIVCLFFLFGPEDNLVFLGTVLFLFVLALRELSAVHGSVVYRIAYCSAAYLILAWIVIASSQNTGMGGFGIAIVGGILLLFMSLVGLIDAKRLVESRQKDIRLFLATATALSLPMVFPVSIAFEYAKPWFDKYVYLDTLKANLRCAEIDTYLLSQYLRRGESMHDIQWRMPVRESNYSIDCWSAMAIHNRQPKYCEELVKWGPQVVPPTTMKHCLDEASREFFR